MRGAREIVTLGILACCIAPDARAELPYADTVLTYIGYSADEIAGIKAGKIATTNVTPAHERDLAAAFAFLVPIPPAELVDQLKAGLMAKVDSNTIARGDLSGLGSSADFVALALSEGRAKRYISAKPGTALNLSAEEVDAFNKLGPAANLANVEDRLRGSLLERYRAYRAKGLDGIAPYAREQGSRSVADDLRASLRAVQALRQYAGAAYVAMTTYPGYEPAGAEDVLGWSQFKAHDVPTIALVHTMFIPDGDAFVVMQRQYYVSEGYNCEQAIAGLLPVRDGTVVVYSNHTSTDQVSGFGGDAKRSIGNKLLSSELRDIFAKVQQRSK